MLPNPQSWTAPVAGSLESCPVVGPWESGGGGCDRPSKVEASAVYIPPHRRIARSLREDVSKRSAQDGGGEDLRRACAGNVGAPCADNIPIELARLSVAVAMTPRAWASFPVQRARIKGFKKGENFNHSPHEAGTSTGTVMTMARRGFKPPELTPEQQSLL